MKKTLNEEKQRILQIMKRINEQAFNDAGEPMMTHSQFRDYSEPSEPEYDDNGMDYEREQTFKDVIDALESHFDTLLFQYGENEYGFLLNHQLNPKGDIMVWMDEGHQVRGIGEDGEYSDEQYVGDLDVDDLIQFFETYREFILTGKDAENKMNDLYRRRAADSRPEYHTGM